MAKGVNIPLTISGLRQAREDLEKLNEEFDKVKDDPIESKKIAKEFNDLSKAIDQTTEELIELNKAGELAGTKFDDLNEVLFQTQEEVLPLSSQIGEMEDRMYQLAASGDTSSKEFKSLQAETIRLRAVIIETDRSIDTMAEGAGNLSGLVTAFGNLGESVLSLNFTQAGKDLKVLGDTFKAFGKTLLANPIFLIVAVVAAIVTAVVTLKDKVAFLGAIFDFFADIVNTAIQALKDFLDWIGLTNFAEQDLAEERKKRAEENLANLESQSNAVQKDYDRKIALLSAEGKSTVELEKQKQKEIAKTNLARMEELLIIFKQERILGKLTKDRAKELKDAFDSANEARKDALNQIQVTEATALKERKEKYKEYKEDRLNFERQIQDLEIELMKEGTDRELAELNLKYDRLIEDTKKNEKIKEEEKEKIVKYYESLRALEEGKVLQAKKDREEEFVKLQEAATNEQLSIIEQFQEDAYQLTLTDQEREEEALRYKYENQLSLARQYGQDTLAIEEAYAKEKADMEDKYRKEKLEKEQAIEEAKLNFISDGLNLASQITELFGKKNEKAAKRAFAVQKAISIAQAVMDTYKGANAIFASAAANPASVLFPAQPFIAAGLAIAGGIANVAKISQTKFGGGSTGGGGNSFNAGGLGGGGGSSSSSSTPSFELFGDANQGNNASSPESVETNQQMTVKAVVVESDITNTQGKVEKMKKNAEL